MPEFEGKSCVADDKVAGLCPSHPMSVAVVDDIEDFAAFAGAHLLVRRESVEKCSGLD